MKGLIFTYGLTYGGAVVSLFNPFYGLLIYICFAILKPPALWHWSVPPGNHSRIIGVAFLIGWALHGFGDQTLGKARPIVTALLGYFLWVILSTAVSAHPEYGAPFIEYMAKIVLPFVAGITLIQTRSQLRQLLWLIIGSCAFLAYEANMAYLDGYNFVTHQFMGLDNNSFSILMVTSFGLALVLGFEDPVRWRRYLMLGVAAAMAHVPMLSMSRGGMLGVFIAATLAMVITPKSPRTWLTIAVTLVIGSMLAGPSVIDRFSTTFKSEDELDASAGSRLVLWRNCTDVALKNPLFGIGQDHWRIKAVDYGWKLGKEAHSLWFQTAAELGLVGVGFLILFYYRVIMKTWRAARDCTEVLWMPTLARMSFVALLGFSVSATFVTVEGFELPYYVALIGACGIKLAYREQANALAAEAEDDDDFDDAPDVRTSDLARAL